MMTLICSRLIGSPPAHDRPLGPRLTATWLLLALAAVAWQVPTTRAADDLWDLAREKQAVHRISTLFTAQNVRDLLATESGIARAIEWCRQTGVTKVYVETFRDNYTAPDAALVQVRDQFRAAGFEVSGCVTTTRVGKRSTGWSIISCFTDPPTQMALQRIFEHTASLFDEIMIDDFWFTDCTCPECDQARAARTVTIAGETFPVSGDSWEDYRCELMVQLSRKQVLEAAKRVNPQATLIIKYPQWYDNFHNRGYDVVRETQDFDRIWVGTETRDYTDKEWGGTPQYEAYFIMRWLGGLGGAKCGGGWYDPYGTTEATYVEQARQTVLGGARESLLFCYGSLLQHTGPANVAALRKQVPELLEVAEQIGRREIVGVAAYKPPSSHPEKEPRVFDFVGMLGVPLVPCHEFPTDAQAGFFSVHALKDPDLVAKLSEFIGADNPTLVTDGLAASLAGKIDLDRPNVQILSVAGEPKTLLELPPEQLNKLRQPLLQPFSAELRAPNRVALCLLSDGSWVIQNFNDNEVSVEINGQPHELPARSWKYAWAK